LDSNAIRYLQESIPGIYVSGSFCTPRPDRDARVVRKPTLEIRVRPGGTRVTTDIDSRLRADAGAGVGRKRLDVGYAVGHDQRLGENGWFFEVRRAGHHPVRFTLPQLTDDTELSRGADAVHD
jgi:hypothetical protein